MGTMGFFAGRGDVIVGYALAVLLGCWAGWHLRGLRDRLRDMGGWRSFFKWN